MWAGARHKVRPQVWAAAVLTFALGFVVAAGTLQFLIGWTPPLQPRADCSKHGFGCGVLGGALVTVFAAAIAFTWLILVRVFRIVNWGYARDARKRACGFVPTAANISDVVGRDDLCRVIEHEMHEWKRRRPQVIVGGVGAGKTAVLVRLTEWLAARGAVPVAVRLRDMKEDEGFRELAARRFKAINEHRFTSDGEADRIWRRLCAMGVVVVLADGLEEAMFGADSRETSIREALEEASHLKVPLVITSRPDNSLVTLNAALIELGPLDEKQALEYVRKSRSRKNNAAVTDQQLRDLMSAAKVAEMPLYLQLTRDLYAHDLFQPTDLTDLDDEHRLDIRLRLLDSWRGFVEEGRLEPDPSITPGQRKGAIVTLSEVAALGLVKDTLELDFKALKVEKANDTGKNNGQKPVVDIDPLSARVASNVGARLEIVQTLQAGVRFRHSIMQAYLGSLWIAEHGLEDDKYLSRGLDEGGREFLMALTMACHHVATKPNRGPHRTGVLRNISKRLLHAAVNGREGEAAPEDWCVLLLAAAYEIDRMVDTSPETELKVAAKRAWPGHSVTSRCVESKHLAIDRIAETKAPDAYGALYELSINERDYRVRLRAAQHLGSGGDIAILALQGRLAQTMKLAGVAKERGFAETTDRNARRFCIQGWILPMMVATAEHERAASLSMLRQWFDVCDGAPATFEGCLAQGFKYEANRVPRPGTDRTAREQLVKWAEKLIEKTDYWYTRLTLLHALTLWMLPEAPRPPGDARERLAHWAGKDPHPFVRAATDLCTSALVTRNPSPYMWIDETGIVAKLGQQSAAIEPTETPSLWLADSLGWVALKPRALRLVADVLLMLNLTDGPNADDNTASQFERTHQASKAYLPPCITRPRERAYLSVLLGDDDLQPALPGDMCGGNCHFHLCPYLLSGMTLRPEFGEAFCRHLATVKGRSEWHDMRKGHLHKFWREMERRARTG
jgi:hypothetical protein